MKKKLEKLSQIAMQSANDAGRAIMRVQHQAKDRSQDLAKDLLQNVSHTVNQEVIERTRAMTTVALATGKSLHQSVQHTLHQAVEHETTQAIVTQVKERGMQVAESTTQGVKFVGSQVVESVKKIDQKLEENHLEIKEKTETVSMGLGIAAGVAAGAAIIGPPLAVAVAPVIGAAATVTGAVAGSAYFYSKWKTKEGDKNLDTTPNGDVDVDTSKSNE